MISFNYIVPLLTLTGLEVILGVDNIIFLSILVSKLPANQQNKARFLGLLFAMLTRILLLLSLVWMSHLMRPLWSWGEYVVSGRTLVLFLGGIFLLVKSTQEIYNTLENKIILQPGGAGCVTRFWGVILQIGLLDIVFSLDSVLTAIGMVNTLSIMIAAIILAVFIMLFVAKAMDTLLTRHPSIKILALSFLMLIGVALVADALGVHIPRAYLYFSMIFSLFVEVINIRLRQKNFS